jgi:chromosome segregation ATPase
MFNVANTKEKCLLALGASLGWEISAVIELDRHTLQSLVERAKAENKQFIYFQSVRKKTGVNRLGVLNPLALEWLERWLNELAKIETDRINRHKTAQRKRKENRKCDRPISNLFDLTPEAINKMLRRLIRHTGIVTTGRVHFHKIRGG